MDITEILGDQLKKLFQFFNEHKINYALVGEPAFIPIVEPRAIMNFYIMLMIKEKEMECFIDLLEEEFESLIPHEEPMRFSSMKIWRVINLLDDRLMIFDFLLAESKFYKNVIERAFETDFLESKLKIIIFEDLLLLTSWTKLAQDIGNLDKFSTAFKNAIDHSYLNSSFAPQKRLRISQGKL
jgi:hypothetical protein